VGDMGILKIRQEGKTSFRMHQTCLILEVLSLRSVSGVHHPQPRVGKTRLSATFIQKAKRALKTPGDTVVSYLFRTSTEAPVILGNDFMYEGNSISKLQIVI